MKKIIVFFIIVCCFSLYAKDFKQPVMKALNIDFKEIKNVNYQTSRALVCPPNITFIPNGEGESTTYLYDSYWDYMPFGLSGTNLHKQEDISLPYQFAAGGWYVGYMVSESTNLGIDRRSWYSYINPDGTNMLSGACNSYNIYREGYVTSDVDPVTGDCFFAWHSPVENDNSYDVFMNYDIYHISGTTGYFKAFFNLIDNPEIGYQFTGHEDDEFNWPHMMIGESPEAGCRRIHIYANNATANTAGYGMYNILYGYADFNADSLLYESELNWTFQSFPFMDDHHYNNISRVNKDILVKDNKVAFFGGVGDSLFCLWSDDYGENFTWHFQEWKYQLENPFQEDGLTYEFYNNDEVTPSELYMVLSNDGTTYNGVFTDNDTKIVWIMGTNLNTAENIEDNLYWAAYYYPRVFSFDIDTGSFDFFDLDIQDSDPGDGNITVPWDLDENGDVDEYYSDGSVYIPISMASYFLGTEDGYGDTFFHDSYFRLAAYDDYIVACWQDCRKHRMNLLGAEGYDFWNSQSETVFITSEDAGDTWSNPRFINANTDDNIVDPVEHLDGNYVEEFEGMKPAYFSFDPELEPIGDPLEETFLLHTVFFDDNDYGGAAGGNEGSGDINGGTVRFATLQIEFSNTDTEDEIVSPVNDYLGQNYPNPFNPITQIKYQIQENGPVSLSIYNIKGQKVRTLVDADLLAGNHRATWNGKDDNGKSVTSGIYFYKLSTKRMSSTRKLILLK